jgi:Zn-dependent protease with chaperone function
MSRVSVAPAGALEVSPHRGGRLAVGAVSGAAAAVVALAVVVGVVAWLAVAWWAGLVLAGLVGAAAWLTGVAPRIRSAEARTLALLGPTRPADPRADARLLNLVEGLSPGAGLARPRVLVIDDDAPNALALGRDARRGVIVATSGLLGSLNRMQLEAVVAHLLVEVRDGTTVAPTLSLAFRPRRTPPPPPYAITDASAVTLTRYPPALISALQSLAEAGPAAPAGAAAVVGPLWLAPPGDRAGLASRIETLEGL